MVDKVYNAAYYRSIRGEYEIRFVNLKKFFCFLYRCLSLNLRFIGLVKKAVLVICLVTVFILNFKLIGERTETGNSAFALRELC